MPPGNPPAANLRDHRLSRVYLSLSSIAYQPQIRPGSHVFVEKIMSL